MTDTAAALTHLRETYHQVITAIAGIETMTHRSHAGPGATPYDRPIAKDDRHILDPLNLDDYWDEREFPIEDDGIIAQAADNAQLYLSALANAVASQIARYQRTADTQRLSASLRREETEERLRATKARLLNVISSSAEDGVSLRQFQGAPTGATDRVWTTPVEDLQRALTELRQEEAIVYLDQRYYLTRYAPPENQTPHL